MGVKTLFETGGEVSASDRLVLELGKDYCCYAFLNNSSKKFELIRYQTFSEFETDKSLLQLKESLPAIPSKVRIGTASADAILRPQHWQGNEMAIHEAIYQEPGAKHFNDTINEWQIINVYSLPLEVYRRLTEIFPGATFFHSYTPALKIYNGFVAPDQIDLYFSTSHFRVIVKRDNQLQLAQTYSYKTPLDVVYYLLKIAYEFGLDQSEVFLIISGLVEQDSALYHELHNYFVNIHFAQAPVYQLPGDEYPQYYFTALYNLAACV